MPKGLRKHIRQEKARIRREVLDSKKQEESIKEMYQKVFKIEPVPEKEDEKQKL